MALSSGLKVREVVVLTAGGNDLSTEGERESTPMRVRADDSQRLRRNN